jgi:hypothetical protein
MGSLLQSSALSGTWLLRCFALKPAAQSREILHASFADTVIQTMAVPLLHLVVMLCSASSSTASVRSLHQSPADAAASSPSDDQLRGGPAASPAPGQLRPMLDAPALPLLRVHLHQAPRHGRVLPASVPRRGRLHSGVDLPRRPRVARRLPRRPVRPHLRQQHRRAAAERRRLVRVQGCHQVRVAPGRRRQVHARSLPRQPRQQPVDGRIPRQPDAPPLLPTSRP